MQNVLDLEIDDVIGEFAETDVETLVDSLVAALDI